MNYLKPGITYSKPKITWLCFLLFLIAALLPARPKENHSFFKPEISDKQTFLRGSRGAFFQKSPHGCRRQNDRRGLTNHDAQAGTHRKIVIDDNLSFIFHRDRSSTVTIVKLFFKGGKRAEPVSKRGLAYLTVRLMISMPDSRDVRKLMHLGSTSFVDINEDYAVITIKSLSEHLNETLDVLTPVMKKPLFTGPRISSIKKSMASRQKSEQDDPNQLMHLEILNTLGSATPPHDAAKRYSSPKESSQENEVMSKKSGYAGSIYGDSRSLNAIKKKDIADFYKKYFNAANMIVSITTDLDEIQVKRTIGTFFSGFPAGESASLTPAKTSLVEKKSVLLGNELPVSSWAAGAARFLLIACKCLQKKQTFRQPFLGLNFQYPLGLRARARFFKKEKQQTLICFAALLPPITPDNFALGYVTENLIGKGIGSRLWHLRSQQNLAYGIEANFTQFRDAGILKIYLKTSNHKKEAAYRLLKEVISGLHRQGVSAAELAAAKVQAGTDFLRLIGTKENRALYQGYFEALGLGAGFMQDFFDELERVTLEQITDYIKKAFQPANLVEIVIGPQPLLPGV